MADHNKSVFISSTFRDMQSERDFLRDEVLAELRGEMKTRGYSLDFIDLRWGISTEGETAAGEKIIKTCFDEIKRSNPYFIVLLGERYGWIPPLEEVRNSLSGINADGIDIRDKSITALEIEYAQTIGADPGRCLYFFRDEIEFPPDTPKSVTDIYRGGTEERKKLLKLKEQISKRFPDQVRRYKASYSPDGSLDLTDLKQGFATSVRGLFAAELNASVPENFVETENIICQSHIENALKSFSARREVMDELTRLLDERRILGVRGESGCGKSFVMAKLAEIYSARPDTVVLPFWCALTENSADEMSLLKILTVSAMKHSEECDRAAFDAVIHCGDAQVLYEQFYNRLHKLAGKKRVVLVIDALNQLARTPRAEQMKWLNTFALPAGVSVVMSLTPDCAESEELERRSVCLYGLPDFTAQEIKEVADSFMKKNNKQLAVTTLEVLSKKQGANGALACANPLYLSLLLDELLYLGKEDFDRIRALEQSGIGGEQAIKSYIEGIIASAPETAEGQFLRFLEKVGRAVGEDFTKAVLAALTLARRGLPEDGLGGIIGRFAGTVFSSADFSLLRKLLRGHLIQKEQGKWDWGHKRLKDVLTLHFKNDELFYGALQKAALAHCLSLSSEDPFRRSELVYYYDAAGRAGEIYSAFTDAAGTPVNVPETEAALLEVVVRRIEAGAVLTDIFTGIPPDTRKGFARALITALRRTNADFLYVEKILLELIVLCGMAPDAAEELATAYLLLSETAAKHNRNDYADNALRIAFKLRGGKRKREPKAAKEPAPLLSIEEASARVAKNENTGSLSLLAGALMRAAEHAPDGKEAEEYLTKAVEIQKRLAAVEGDAERFALYCGTLEQLIRRKELGGVNAAQEREVLRTAKRSGFSRFGVIKDAPIRAYQKIRRYALVGVLALALMIYTVFLQAANSLALAFYVSIDYLIYRVLILYTLKFFAALFTAGAAFCGFHLCGVRELYSEKRRYWIVNCAVCCVLGLVFIAASLGLIAVLDLYSVAPAYSLIRSGYSTEVLLRLACAEIFSITIALWAASVAASAVLQKRVFNGWRQTVYCLAACGALAAAFLVPAAFPLFQEKAFGSTDGLTVAFYPVLSAVAWIPLGISAAIAAGVGVFRRVQKKGGDRR